jgi:hypothetical protein
MSAGITNARVHADSSSLGYYPDATGLVFLILLFIIGLAILIYVCTRKNRAFKAAMEEQPLIGINADYRATSFQEA